MKEMYKLAIASLMEEVHLVAKGKGWWSQRPERTFGDQIALMHSELSEALEEFRKDDVKIPEMYAISPDTGKRKSIEEAIDLGLKPEGIAVEFADVIIRILDTCEFYQIPLVRAIELKLAYNKTRPYLHGGKRI